MKQISAITIAILASAPALPNIACAQTKHSTNIHGALGLNTIPNARMDKTGTLRTQLSFQDPYLHGFLGIQIADSLYIGIRQSAEFSSFDENAKNLFPGIDAKLRLIKESPHIPEIAFGVQSGLGHKRQSGEYLALSKRYNNFDFTAGIGWGRFATGAHFDNPLKSLGSHFDQNRNLDGENPTKPRDWLTGQNIGLFAGLEYFTPIKGLSLKADYGGDDYEAETNAFNFEPAAPWSVGFNYKPWNFMDISLAAQGTNKIMARLALQGNIKKWQHQSHQSRSKTQKTLIPRKETAHNIFDPHHQPPKSLYNIHTSNTIKTASLDLNQNHSSPHQMGRALINLANYTHPNIEAFAINTEINNLRGPRLTFMRKSLEQALKNNNGSTNEIWHTTEFENSITGLQKLSTTSKKPFHFKRINALLDNQISLSEEDTSLLRRTSLILSTQQSNLFKDLTAGLGLRFNLSNNLGKIRRLRPQASLPIKSDVADFADRFFALENLYVAMPFTIGPNIHTNIIGGYIDENFVGTGAEILFRPYDKRFAIGAEGWSVQKRDPFTTANLGTFSTSLLSAHVNAWYDIPKADIVLGLKAGRFLARDMGASASLTKNFKNGATLEAYASFTDKSDIDIFGGTTNADHGLRITIPLGGYKYTPNSQIRVTAAPFGRDIGQTVNNPTPLYQTTTPLSLAHIAKHWNELNQ
ncbi:MAG: YjbH domain-containing protein [Bdellovibrionales bacterium]